MDLMAARRRILMNTGEFIPPGYQQYDYLETPSGHAYIDTGVAGNDATIQINTTIVLLDRANYRAIFGSYDGTNTNAAWLLRHGTDSKQLTFTLYNTPVRSSSLLTLPVTTVIGIKMQIMMEYGHAVVTCNGVETPLTVQDTSAGATTGNIYIGNYPTIQTTGTTTRYYDFSISKGGKIVRRYVPVVRKSDSKPGFYDTVNYTFSPSIGSADFTAGND